VYKNDKNQWIIIEEEPEEDVADNFVARKKNIPIENIPFEVIEYGERMSAMSEMLVYY
jgi:hypothetical protein